MSKDQIICGMQIPMTNFKNYGICINGCIDGYSRNILWCEATYSSNVPRIVAGHFFHQLKNLQHVPEKSEAIVEQKKTHRYRAFDLREFDRIFHTLKLKICTIYIHTEGHRRCSFCLEYSSHSPHQEWWAIGQTLQCIVSQNKKVPKIIQRRQIRIFLGTAETDACSTRTIQVTPTCSNCSRS